MRSRDEEKEEEQENGNKHDDEEESPTSSSDELDMEALKSLTLFVQMGGTDRAAEKWPVRRGSSDSMSSTNSPPMSSEQTQSSSFALPTLLQQAPNSPSAGHLPFKHACSPASASIQATGVPAKHLHVQTLDRNLEEEPLIETWTELPNRVAASVFKGMDPKDDEPMACSNSTENSAANDPYANALILHREKIELTRIDLQAEHVDSLAARLSTQRQDALAKLEASQGCPILQEDLDEIRVVWDSSSLLTNEKYTSIRCNPILAAHGIGMCFTEQEKTDPKGAACGSLSSSLSTARSVLEKSVQQDPFLTGDMLAMIRQRHSASVV